MAFNSALSAAQLTKLRGATNTVPTYSGRQYISLCPNTTVFAARVNQASFTASFAQVTYDTVTTGAYTDLEIGQTIFLSASNDIRAAYFIGRVRKTPTSSVLYINQTSAAIADNDYIFVVNDYRNWDILAREVATVQYKDFEIAYRTTPPVIYNLDSAYAGIVSGTPAGYTIAFAALAVAVASGATIASYAWTIPTGGTVTAGAANTANVTVRFDAGFYWVSLVVTDSNGITATRRIPVWSVPADLSAQVALAFSGAQITNTADGWSATVSAFEGIDSVLDNTLCCIWDVERYNGTTGAVVNNVKFVGRLRKETTSGQGDATYAYLKQTTFELEGVGAQLQRLRAPLLALRDSSTPTVWDEIKVLTTWRAIAHVLHEHSTFLTLHSLQFDSTADTFRAQMIGTQGGNLLTTVNELAKWINACIEFNAQGRAQVIRDARYLTTTERAALPTIANWTTQDALTIQLDIDHIPTVGRVEASGGMFNAFANLTTPLLAIAPGVAQASGENTTQLASQLLQANVSRATAQSELNTRTGHHYALSNPTDILQVTHPDGYNFMSASVGEWYTWTLAATTNDRGRVYTTATRWLITQATYTHNNATGTKTVDVTYARETSGSPGQTVDYPATGEMVSPSVTIPVIEPFPSFPELPSIIFPSNPDVGIVPQITNPTVVTAPRDGNTQLVWTNQPARLYLAQNFLKSSSPTYTDVTPTTGKSIIAACFDPFGKGAYCLVAESESWTLNLLNGSGKGDAYPVAGFEGTGSYNAVNDRFVEYRTILEGRLEIRVALPLGISTSVNAVSMDISLDFVKSSPYVSGIYYPVFEGTEIISVTKTSDYTGTISISGLNITASQLLFRAAAASNGGVGGHAWITKIQVVGSGIRPPSIGASDYTIYYTSDVFAAAPVWTAGATVSGAYGLMRATSTQGSVFIYSTSGGVVQYSDDYGATWSEITLDTGSGGNYGGGDVIPIGGASLFAGLTTIEKATTLGGAYSAEANGTLTAGQGQMIKIPRYQFGSITSKNTGTSPQYLLGGTELIAGHALWRVTTSGKTGITPLTDTAFTANGAEVAPFDGRRIAVLMTDGTVRRLWTSTNQGGSFTNRGNLTDDVAYLRMRQGDRTGKQLFIADGTAGPAYSPDFGANIYHKYFPQEGTLTGSVLGIEPYG